MSTSAVEDDIQATTALIPSGLLAVHKPKEWSSSNVVSKIRWILSEGAKQRLHLSRRPKIKVI